MFFHSPIFASFLIAAAIPLILYLIFRSRRKDSSLGSIYILRRLVQSKRKFSEWKRYVIIAIRTLGLIAIPIIFMQPYLPWHPPDEGVFPDSPASTHRIVLIDLSRSMAASFGNRSRHDASVSLTRQILRSARFPGRVDLIAMQSDAPLQTFENLPLDSQLVDRTVADLSLHDQSADFDKPLRTAAELFRASPFKNKELYILTDFSSRDLKRYSALGAAFRKLGQSGVKVFPLSYERDDADNFAVLEMTPGYDLVLAGQPTIFYVTLAYYGTKPSADTYLTIKNSQGRVFFDQPVTLAPGEKTLEIPLALWDGEQTLTATLKEDEYPLDNSLSRSFRVAQTLNVVVAQGQTQTKGFDNPREWLALALDEAKKKTPTGIPGDTGQGSAQVSSWSGKGYETNATNVNPMQLTAASLRTADALIILDADAMSPQGIDAVYDYTTRGGTVIIAPGPTAKPASFNEAFARLLPADIAAPVRQQIDPESYQQVVVERTTDRFLRELEDARHGNIGRARFYNWYPTVQGSERRDSSTLLSLTEGASLLMERPIGRGRVLLWTAGFGGDWHSLAVHAAYPVFFARLLTGAAANIPFPLNLKPGEPIIRQVDSEHIRVLMPDGHSQQVPTVKIDDRRYIRFEGTQMAGDYRLFLDPDNDKKTADYHVAANYSESDFRPIAEPERSHFQNLIGAKILSSEPELVLAVGQGYEGAALATWFAIVVFTLIGVEAWLCRRFFA